jgi:hypothetical protein
LLDQALQAVSRDGPRRELPADQLLLVLDSFEPADFGEVLASST